MSLATRHKPPVHHKKVSGKHHKATKTYLKTYWPYLPLAALVAIGLLVNSLLMAPGKVLGVTSDFTSNSLLADTNTDRTAAGDAPLSLNADLNAAAQAKANDMVTRNYWSHNTPDGQTPWTFIERTGYTYTNAGENLAYGFSGASSVLSAWMNSPEHRANLLNTAFQDVGFGIASSPNFNHSGPATLVVAMYGARNTATVQTSSTTTTSAPPMKPVARLELVTNEKYGWSTYLIALAGAMAIVIFSVRHARAWHKLLVHGEDFILDHIWLDMIIVSFAMGSYLLVQNVGLIG